ncbi:hypothetical protein FRB90_008542 [Tulasnella sp. 427]|nr:hypothetical protein FRB90_008542 [Tulasnella sp. 427]
MIQKRGIRICHRLASDPIGIHLIERLYVNDVDLIVDPGAAIIYFTLAALPAENSDLIQRLSRISSGYSRILLIFEAYTPSHSRTTRSSRENLDTGKAFKHLRLSLAIAESTDERLASCRVNVAFALDEDEAALYAWMFGDAGSTSARRRIGVSLGLCRNNTVCKAPCPGFWPSGLLDLDNINPVVAPGRQCEICKCEAHYHVQPTSATEPGSRLVNLAAVTLPVTSAPALAPAPQAAQVAKAGSVPAGSQLRKAASAWTNLLASRNSQQPPFNPLNGVTAPSVRRPSKASAGVKRKASSTTTADIKMDGKQASTNKKPAKTELAPLLKAGLIKQVSFSAGSSLQESDIDERVRGLFPHILQLPSKTSKYLYNWTILLPKKAERLG